MTGSDSQEVWLCLCGAVMLCGHMLSNVYLGLHGCVYAHICVSFLKKKLNRLRKSGEGMLPIS